MRHTVLGAFALLAACSAGSPAKVFTPLVGPDGGYVSIGSACRMYLEDDPSFAGFNLNEFTVESEAGQPLGAPVCLAYNFQGRVSCPYGQSFTNAGLTACTTPNGQPVTVEVAPQCVNRPGAVAVVWSCKCAAGSEPADGGSYCACPSGTSCTSAGPKGSYCLSPGALANTGTCTSKCEPGVHPCN
ncbi:MAG: hypothetical protein M3O36_06380 [Myxococcota bacterium]|nr:hypothetical protein [Myxococcota bacterium]